MLIHPEWIFLKLLNNRFYLFYWQGGLRFLLISFCYSWYILPILPPDFSPCSPMPLHASHESPSRNVLHYQMFLFRLPLCTIEDFPLLQTQAVHSLGCAFGSKWTENPLNTRQFGPLYSCIKLKQILWYDLTVE